MTEDAATVTPEVLTAIDGVYQQGFKAGRLQGYQDGINAARAHLAAMPINPDLQAIAAKLPLDTKIEDLNLTVRSYNCLKRESMHTIGEILRKSDQDLLDIRNFGQKGVLEVIEKLGVIGYSIRKEEPRP